MTRRKDFSALEAELDASARSYGAAVHKLLLNAVGRGLSGLVAGDDLSITLQLRFEAETDPRRLKARVALTLHDKDARSASFDHRSIENAAAKSIQNQIAWMPVITSVETTFAWRPSPAKEGTSR